MRIEDLGERGLIERLAALAGEAGEGARRGIGDDAAVIDAARGGLSIATCDAQVDGVHFRSDSCSPEQIGSRVANANLSDVAAMGGSPRWALVSLLLPPGLEVSAVDGIYRGLVRALGAEGASIVGGNIARSDGPLAVDLFLLGEAPPGGPLLRSGAAPGQVLCVTGPLGGARAGLEVEKEPSLRVEPAARESALARYREARHRIPEGRLLAREEGVTACIDLSDGLIGDAGHVAKESGVEVLVDADRVPVDPAAAAVALASGGDPVEWALCGGEDFELLFTVDPERADRVLERLGAETGAIGRSIGSVRAGDARVVVERDGRPWVAPREGFDHFRRD